MIAKGHPDLCTVINIAQISFQKLKARHSTNLPVAVFVDTDRNILYLTSTDVTKVILSAGKKAYPDISKVELMKYSTHYIRVQSCMCLDETGISPDLIRKILRWMGKPYHVYLRHTTNINIQYNLALEESSQTVMDLLDSNIDNETQTLS